MESKTRDLGTHLLLLLGAIIWGSTWYALADFLVTVPTAVVPLLLSQLLQHG